MDKQEAQSVEAEKQGESKASEEQEVSTETGTPETGDNTSKGTRHKAKTRLEQKAEAAKSEPKKRRGCLGWALGGLRRLMKVACWMVVIGVVAVVLLVVFAEPLIKFAVNNSVDYLDVDAQVADVNVRLLTQTLILRDVVVRNPPGFIEKDAFKAAKIEFRCDILHPSHFMKRVYLQNPHIRLEGKYGKRILPASVRRSNVFVLVRELGNLAGRDLEKELKEKQALGGVKMSELQEAQINLRKFGRIRLDNLHVENGMKDVLDVGSVIIHDDVVEMTDSTYSLCDVVGSLRGVFFDFEAMRLAVVKSAVQNPEGYPKEDAVAVDRVVALLDADPESGLVRVKKVTVDSPLVRLEDQQGSLLGAIGLDNNLMEITKSLSVFHGVDLATLFNEDFEIEIHDKDMSIPPMELVEAEVSHIKLGCSSNDGVMVGRVATSNGVAVVDDIRINLANIRARVTSVHANPVTQLLSVDTVALRNPAGFPEENAFLMKKLTATTDLIESNIRGNRVLVINEVNLSDFFVRLDSRNGTISDLMGFDNNLFGLID